MTSSKSGFRLLLPEITILLIPTVFFYLLTSTLVGGGIVTSPIPWTCTFATLIFCWQMFAYQCLWWSPDRDQYSHQPAPISNNLSSKLLLVWTLWMTSHFVCVLIGAPLFESVAETAAWSTLVTCLLSPPVLSLLDADVDVWMQVLLCGQHEDDRQQRLVYYQACGVALGSWLSTFTVPLDWDRPWQKWPIPIVSGAVLGYCAGVLASCLVTIRRSKSSKFH